MNQTRRVNGDRYIRVSRAPRSELDRGAIRRAAQRNAH